MKNAAAAATDPMSITRTAPPQGFCPVTFALKKPKVNRHATVITQDHFNPSTGSGCKKIRR